MVARPKRREQDGVEIVAVDIDRLRQADWNPREIEDERMSSLMASIDRDPDFMWQRPILALRDGTVYAGNQRLAACVALGWRTVPAILEDVPEDVARQRAIKDNASWGEWNREALATTLASIPEGDRAHLGFTDDEMVGILRQLPTQPVPPPPDDGTGTLLQNRDGERGRTPSEMLGEWTEGAIRNVVLYYETAEYERVSGMLADIREHLGTESNADAVAAAVGEAYANDCAGTEGTGPGAV